RVAATGGTRRRVTASGVGSRGARRRTLARAVAAAFGRAEGCNASDPVPAGRRAAERARINGDADRASTGPAVARNERAAPAVAERHAGNTDHAFGRDHAGHVDTGAWKRQAWKRQAGNGAIARARSKTGDTIIAVSGDNAGDAVARTRRQRQARNVPRADAGCNADHPLR